MKKKTVIFIVCMAVFLLVSSVFIEQLYVCIHGIKIDYSDKGIYSEQEVDLAAHEIKEKVSQFRGRLFFDKAVLYSLKVEGEDCLEYCRSLNDDADYTEAVCFSSVMRSPVTGGGGWNSNSIYHWNWYLARTDGGEWELITWGYG